ncbi:MAG: protein kinase [Chitinivibrionales bacterium]
MDISADPTPPTGKEPNNPLMDGSDDVVPAYGISMPEIGQKIGPNRILELIEEGGMANVYKVWHEGLEIVRAVKILKPGFNEESKQRLQTEAKISAHLHHPNIVEIFGVNFWNDTVPYLEMEFIDGYSLKDLLKHHKQGHFTFALSIGYFVCNALHYAHNQVYTLYGKPYHGVVHRDIKPANILLARSGAIKLADFGIAKPADISLHTVGQKVMGTFTYLSPEQLNGESLDCRCDIYSLGTVIYEIITGVKAFPQKTMAELVQKKMVNDYRPLDSFGVDVPRRLCAIIDKSMELNREKRFANASEFSGELIGLLKKIIQKTPDQIVSDHIKNPAVPPPLKRKRALYLSTAVVVSAGVIAALLLAALIVFPEFGQKLDNRFFKKMNSLLSPATAHGNAVAEPQSALDKPSPPDNAAAAVDRPAGPSASPAGQPGALVTEEKLKKNVDRGTDLLKKGLKAAGQKQYREAVGPLEITLKKGLPDSLKNMAVVSLLECYIALGDTARARRLTASEPVNDGYYYLLCGKLFFALRKYDRAIESFGNAQTIRSAFKSNTLEEATYFWARSLDKMYQLKPNSGNKRACFRAWQQFSKAFCPGSGKSRQCGEAAERLSFLRE